VGNAELVLVRNVSLVKDTVMLQQVGSQKEVSKRYVSLVQNNVILNPE